jgi:Zn-dependent membrane protease YugP
MQIHVIGSFAFIFSWFVCLFQFAYLKRYSRESNRKMLASCEVARAILDSQGLAHAVVDFVPSGRPSRDTEVKKLFLPKPVFESSSLYAAARAGHEAVLMIEAPASFLPLKSKWMIVTCLSSAAWVFMLAGFYGPLTPFGFMGSFFFTLAFLAAICFVPREWENAEKAYELLKKTDFFEVDELMKIRNILRGLRLESMALILKGPFKQIASMIGRGDGF